ncbi:MAG: hypothetical protein M1482_03005 [Chloroflexi bacterium]|nr:hypothetical protein [Chloroflexota bacterium]
MDTLSLADILDDLRAAEEGLHKFERRYWISSDDFYALYSRGALDDGENSADLAEWAGHYKLKQKRESSLAQISKQRLDHLRQDKNQENIRLLPAEPSLRVS